MSVLLINTTFGVVVLWSAPDDFSALFACRSSLGCLPLIGRWRQTNLLIYYFLMTAFVRNAHIFRLQRYYYFFTYANWIAYNTKYEFLNIHEHWYQKPHSQDDFYQTNQKANQFFHLFIHLKVLRNADSHEPTDTWFISIPERPPDGTGGVASA